jgi:RNA polymerase sigma factor (sigma-70 family)
MRGPLDLSKRSKAVEEARRIAGQAVAPLRRWLTAALADELALLASDALLFHRAARAALADASLPRAAFALAARGADEPANDVAPRPSKALATREQKLVAAARGTVQRMARFIARSVGGDAEELAAAGMLAVAEEAARWEGSIEGFANQGLRAARDAMRYARKQELRKWRREVVSIWVHLEPDEGESSDVLEALAARVVTCEMLRLTPEAFGERADEQMRRRELAKALERARERLEARERRVIEGLYERREELKAVASAEGYSYRTAKRVHHDALLKLHEWLAREGHGQERAGQAPAV